MANRIMIDLETVGSTPGCGILSIGAVAFHVDGWVVDELYVVVSRISCREHGLFEEQDTLDWWAKQTDEARQILLLAEDPDGTLSLPAALDELNRFVARHPGCTVYGNGSDFDNAILAAAARAAGCKLAWPFWQNRCYRTMKGRTPQVKLARVGTHHNALDDARTQAQHLGQIERSLALTSAKVDAAQRFIGWMADWYQRRTSRRILCFSWNTLSRAAALDSARATFDAIDLDEPFGCPGIDWDEDDAQALVDEDLRHWEAA